MGGYYGGGDIADLSERGARATQGINIQSTGINLGSIMQPYSDSANNGGMGLQLTRGAFSPYGNGGSGSPYIARSSTMDTQAIMKWGAIVGVAALGAFLIIKRRKS